MLEERKIKVGQVEINFAEGPKSGPSLVLLHGLPGRWQEFMPIMPTIILQWHVYDLDYRGQGKSGRVPGQYQAKYYCEDTLQFLQEHVAEPAVLFGQSAGGVVALKVAAQLPELVKAIVVGDSPIEMEELIAWMTSDGFKYYFSALKEIAGEKDHSVEKIAEMIADIPVQVPGQDEQMRYGDSPGIEPIQIQQLAITLSNMDPGVLEYHATGRATEFLEGFDLEKVLGQIKCPVLLLQANPALGGMMTNKAVKQIKSRLPRAEHFLIESAGHDLGLDAWETGPLLRLLLTFLDSL